LQLFEQFCDETNLGDDIKLTDTLYGQFVVESIEYSDDHTWFGVLNYLKTKVIPHKVEVFKAGIELSVVLPEQCRIDELEFINNLWIHDLSKFSAVEALGYSGWNFQTKSGDKEGFEIAWNHHKNHNPHHPEYWLSVDKGGQVEPLRMPNIYIVEMIADWIGAGITYGNTLEKWLPENLHKFKLHPDSLLFLHQVLRSIGIKTRFQGGFLFYDN